MDRFGIKVWMVVMAALVAIIGCGGGGSSASGSSPNGDSRTRVLRTLGQSQMALIQSGFQTVGQVGGINGSTGGTSGGGGGVPFIGAFVRNIGVDVAPPGFRGTPGGGTSGTSGGTTGTSGSTSAGTDGGNPGDPVFYFDEFLGLWVESSWSENEYSNQLYLDQAKEQPAGSFHSTFSSWETYPVTSKSTYEITAGPFAGAHGTYDSVFESDSTGHMAYENAWPGFGTDKGNNSWGPNGWDSTYESTQANGEWSKSTGHFNESGVGNSVFENSLGYKWSYQYNADGSGSGLIEGPDSGLPAHVTWTAEGHYRVEWADGSVDEWDLWEMFGDGGFVGGTTGSVGTTGG